MRRCFFVLAVLLACTSSVPAKGLLIPKDVSLTPLAMVNHKVAITIDDQIATTKVEQTFRNHTDRQLEATYIFPVPKGASVNKFTMWVGGKEVSGELLDAAKAKQTYTEIVRRTHDPGLLEYMGNNLFKLSVFPVPPRRPEGVAELHLGRQPRRWSGRVHLPAEDGWQGHADAGRVLGQGDDQVAARDPERLQPHARPQHHPHRRQGSQPHFEQGPGPPRQGLPALLLPRRQGRRPDGPDPSAGFDGRRLLHAAAVAEGRAEQGQLHPA